MVRTMTVRHGLFEHVALPRPAPPRPRVCAESTGAAAEPDDTWGPLLDSGLLEGWPIY